MSWKLTKTVKIGGIKYRSIVNEQGIVFMTLKAKNALSVVDSYNARKNNALVKEHEDLAYGEAVMSWTKITA